MKMKFGLRFACASADALWIRIETNAAATTPVKPLRRANPPSLT
jgi:hypothetical protein